MQTQDIIIFFKSQLGGLGKIIEMKYIKIKISSQEWKISKFQSIFLKILYIVFPVANPDFEKVIDQVREWYIEFDEDEPIPIREIGVDENSKVIAKMPYKNNYGYWTDNSLTYDDFLERFDTTEISQADFEDKWKEL